MPSEAAQFFGRAREAFASVVLPDGIDLLLLDYAGIGDASHARLIAQHLVRERRVAWITNPLVAGLYRDDPMPVFPGVSSPWRDPSQAFVRDELIVRMEAMAHGRFPGVEVLDVSGRVARYFHAWLDRQTHYGDLFFDAAGVKRDPTIRHTIRHLGDPPKGRYIVIERGSLTFGDVPPHAYVQLVKRLARSGIAAYSVGGPDLVPIPGTIDATGKDLYDTFSIVKGALGFIGRASGNESLTFFLPDLPLWEVSIPEWGGAAPCGYHTVTPVTVETLDRVAEYYE